MINVFDITVAITGLNKKTATGIDNDKVYTYSASHTTYYPISVNVREDAIRKGHRENTRDVDRWVRHDRQAYRCHRYDHSHRHGLQFLEELDLAYAPQYSSAKDLVNMAGFIIDNVINGRMK